VVEAAVKSTALYTVLYSILHQQGVRGRTLSSWICDLSWLPSLDVTEHEITGRRHRRMRPRACFDGTNTYGTFCTPRPHES